MTKRCLIANRTLTLPTQPPLTFAGAPTHSPASSGTAGTRRNHRAGARAAAPAEGAALQVESRLRVLDVAEEDAAALAASATRSSAPDAPAEPAERQRAAGE